MRRPWSRAVFTLLLLFLVGIGVALLFNGLSSANDDLASTISKLGAGIAVTTVAGAIVTASFKLVDEQRARDQERRKVFSEIVRAYNQVKSARRNLKAWGSLTTRSEPALQAEEAKELRMTMAKLSDAQLQLEAIVREINESHLFKPESPIKEKLEKVETYINHSMLDRWEAFGGKIWEGADPKICNDLRLQDFEKNFRDEVRVRMDDLTKELHRELFGSNVVRRGNADRPSRGQRDSGGAMQNTSNSVARLERDTAERSSGAAGSEAAQNISEREKVQKDLLWETYLDLRNHARHAETVRANAVNYVLVLTAALITVISLDRQITRDDWPLCLFILFIGLFGTLSSLAYIERYDRNSERAHTLRDNIDKQYLSSRVQQLRDEADEMTKKKYRVLSRVKSVTGGTHLFWLVLPIATALLGGTLTILALIAA